MRELIQHLRAMPPPKVIIRCGATLRGGKPCREEMAYIVADDDGSTVGAPQIRGVECPKVARHVDQTVDLWPPNNSKRQAAWREAVREDTFVTLFTRPREA